ncbi:MAG: hypothetical protein QOK27_205 [Gemmatimonadales bacterium]|nr:hypothetical protein [Gemmatimonadales bacterium]
MRSRRRLPLTLLTVTIGFVFTACSESGLPTNPSETQPSFSTAEQRLTQQQRHDELKTLLRAQQERIKQERELRKAGFQQLHAEWKAYRRTWKRAGKGSSNRPFDLLRCEPRPYDGDAAIIGPDGGTLHVGEHQLVIPKGALTREELIIAEAPTSSLVDVEFSPEGLTFGRPAELTLSYKGCDVPADVGLLLAYVGWGNRILELPPSQDRRDLSEVVGEVGHFSQYAVAY